MLDVILLGFEQSSGIIMDGDGGDLVTYAVVFAAALTRVVFTCDLSYHVHALGHLAEDRVTIVQKWSRGSGDEKLGAVGVGSGICHGEYTRGTMAEEGVEFVRELVTRAAPAAFSRISALQHEVCDYTVESDVIVIAPAGQVQEIGDRDRCFFAVERGINVTSGSVKRDFNV